MRKGLLFLVFCLFSLVHLNAGNEPLPGDSLVTVKTSVGTITLSGLAFSDPEPLGEFSQITIPIKRANNLIIVEARIDSVVGNFVLDFGAPYLVLNQTYFRNYEIDYSRNTGSVNSAGGRALRTKVKRLELQELFYQDLDADVVNLGEIENRRGIKILGLLGVSLFKELAVELDLQNNQIRIYKTNNGNGEQGSISNWTDQQPDLKTNIEIYNNVILLKGEIGGRKLRLSLDTGAEVNVLDSRLPGKVFEMITITRRMMLTGADGRRTEVLAGNISELKLDELALKEMKTIVTNLSGMSETYGIRIDGMLGYEFIANGVVNINFARKELNLYLYK